MTDIMSLEFHTYDSFKNMSDFMCVDWLTACYAVTYTKNLIDFTL